MFLLLLAACLPDVPKDTGEDTDTADADTDTGEACLPEVAVDPLAHDFGELAAGYVLMASFTVSNTGCEALEVYGLALEDSTLGDVFLVSAIGAVLIPPSAQTTFNVGFSPVTAATYETRVLLDTSDAVTPQVAIDLAGVGEAAVAAVSPSTYDFGTVGVHCTLTAAVTVTNTGNADLLLTDATVVGATTEFTVSTEARVPITLAPGESTTLTVTYTPTDTSADSVSLVIETNDSVNPTQTVPLTGTGTDSGACG